MMTAVNLQAAKSSGGINPQYRIRCNGSTIMIGSQEFLSASDALELYISQYEGTGLLSKPKTYKRSANDLLNPKSALHMTAERSLETGIRDTDKELELADAKDSMNESLLKMKKSVALRAEAKKNYLRKQRERVEEALNKSQELLNDLEIDDYPDKTECPSEVGSLSTEILTSMNPVAGYQDSAGGSKIPTWKSRHVFGYKRPRNRRSKTLSSIQISHDMLGLTDNQSSQTFSPQKSKNANTSNRVTFQDEPSISPLKNDVVGFDDDVSLLLSESPKSRLPRSPDKKARERSRSVSPSILKRERKLFESGLRDKPIPDIYTDFDVTQHKTPSWIDTMNLSDVSDKDWKKADYTSSRPPPSWVDGMDKSDITSVATSKPVKKLELQDLLRPIPIITNTHDSSANSDVNDTSLPPPGLTYRDLVGDTSKLGQTNTQTAAQNFQPSLSSKLDDLKQKTTAALERYHERMQSNEDSPLRGSQLFRSVDNPPRCSSLDTEALIAGIPPPGSSDILGASPIKKHGDNDSLITEMSSPGKPRRPPSASTDVVLEGDRPWEKTPSFKPAVSVDSVNKSKGDNESPNYSGGSQPGSLEALKNMIFKLQQEASLTDSEDEGSRRKLSERVRKLREEAAGLGINIQGDKEGGDSDKAPGDIPSLKGYNFKSEPGGQSLEKALVHLERLKNLVNTTQQQQSPDKQNTGVAPLCANMTDT